MVIIQKAHLLLILAAAAILLANCAQNTPEAKFSRGERAMSEGDIIGASLYFEEFIKEYSDHPLTMQVYNYLANCHIMLKDFGNARAVFEEVKAKYGANDARIALTCEFQIGRTYMEEGNVKAAEEQYNSIIAAATDSTVQYNAHQQLALAYARQKRTEESAKQFDTMVQIANDAITDPTESFYLKLEALVGNAADRVPGKADIMKASGEFEKAREVYKSTLAVIDSVTGIYGIEQEKQNVTLGWAHTWAESGDYISAATTYDLLLNNPSIMDNVKPMLISYKIQSMERLLQSTGETVYSPESIAILVKENSRIVDGYPNTVDSRQAMIRIAQLVKDATPSMSQEYVDRVIAEFEKDISEPVSENGPPNAMFGIADTYISVGQYDKAKEAIARLQKAYSNIQEFQQPIQARLYYIQQLETQAKMPTPAPEINIAPDTPAEPETAPGQ